MNSRGCALCMTRPTTADVTNAAKAHGRKISPAWMALRPSTDWSQSDSYAMPAHAAADSSAPAVSIAVKELFFSSDRSSIGFSLRRSATTNATIATTVDGEQRDRRRGGPRAADQRVGQRRRGGGEGHHAGQVDPLRVRVAGLGHDLERERHRHHADRQIHQENPAPAEVRGEQPARDRAHGRRRAVDRPPCPERDAPVAPGVGAADQRHRRREHRRPAQPLHAARGDQHAHVRREAAGQRRGREQDQSGQVQLLAPDPVRDAAHGQHQRAEYERVQVDHPLQVGEGRVQLAGHVRQRHVHDRHIDEQHEGAGADRDQRPPLAHCHPPGIRLSWYRAQPWPSLGGYGSQPRKSSRISTSGTVQWWKPSL